MTIDKNLLRATAALLLAACSSSQPDVTVAPADSATAPAPLASAAPTAIATATPTATASAVATPPTPPKPAPVVTWKGLSAPESVFVDVEGDRYLVTNVAGKPDEADNNGFISELAPDGTVKNLKLVAASDKVKLNAPKGITLVKGVIYVADLDTVRMFDGKTGAPKGEIKIEGATFLNDVAAGPDGKVYVADSAVKPGPKGFDPTGTDAIWVIEKGKAKALVKSKDLHGPNGLVADDKGLLVNTLGAAEVFRVGPKGDVTQLTTTPKGMLDGMAMIGSTILVSSWQGEAVYRGTLGGSFEPVVEHVAAPADFAYDKKRGRIILPRMMNDAIEAYEVALPADTKADPKKPEPKKPEEKKPEPKK